MVKFTELEAWKSAMQLMREVYKISQKFPKDERFGLVRQISDASTSILANLAEGCGRYTYPDKAAKFVIARGECTEVEAFLLIVEDLGFVSREEIAPILVYARRTQSLISGLIHSMRSRS